MQNSLSPKKVDTMVKNVDCGHHVSVVS